METEESSRCRKVAIKIFLVPHVNTCKNVSIKKTQSRNRDQQRAEKGQLCRHHLTVVDKLAVVKRLLWQLGRALDAVTALERRPAAERLI